ncbi:hypothetical protein OESDEN_13056 [Oesophagostomum dentatum]|uniref:Uncharacterized protein n=1 Tax=Oesophagostomum dentatum TaxID=61180 RepID=A0A0B1SUJ9_OESDE|nr:hypothetical protein OESDEN_13056 [Oesophagostomum dentatum]
MNSAAEEKSHLSAVFRSFNDSCLASERIQDSSSKLIELDTRRQKLREASRLLRKPHQVRFTFPMYFFSRLFLSSLVKMNFFTSKCF